MVSSVSSKFWLGLKAFSINSFASFVKVDISTALVIFAFHIILDGCEGSNTVSADGELGLVSLRKCLASDSVAGVDTAFGFRSIGSVAPVLSVML